LLLANDINIGSGTALGLGHIKINFNELKEEDFNE